MEEKKCINGGLPEHVPTLENKCKVEAFVCAGFTHLQIANYLEIDEKTLRKYYKDQLDKAKMDKTIALSTNLYKDALEGDKASREFWLKCQARWAYAKPPEDDKKTVTETLLEKLIDKL